MRIDPKILKNLLPGLLPLLVFVIAGELWGDLVGLYVAIGFGFVELIFSYLKFGKFEKFILLDLGLLILLGSVSILLKDDIYFKLKPAFIELIFAAILGFSVFSSRNIILEMSMRYMKDVQIVPSAKRRMDKSLRVILVITLVHILLVVYSAFFMTKEAWAFISGVLFYLVILGYFGLEFIKTKMLSRKKGAEEILPVVDEEGNVIGKAPRSDCHFNPAGKILHPVIHMHVFNIQGQLFLQHRSMNKKVQPGMWDTAVGGHVSFGEDLETSLRREAQEEIGISVFQPRLIKKYIWETDVEKELVFMFSCTTREDLTINPVEISEGRYWDITDIIDGLGKGIFTSNFEKEFMILSQRALISQK